MKVYELFDRYDIHDVTVSRSSEVKSIDKIEKLVETLEENCGEMVAAYQKSGIILFRGLNSNIQAIMTGIRPDRKPVEMNSGFHEVLHDAFLELGLKATRKNSIFCTTNEAIAEEWGSNIYAVFVKDGWSGTVFEKIKKGYVYNSLSLIEKYKFNMGAVGSRKQYIDKTAKEVAEELKEFKPKSFSGATGLGQILDAKYDDVLITGDSYMGIRSDSPILKTVLEDLGIKARNL